MIELSKLGEIQLRDVERSGVEWHNYYARTCTVLQGNPPKSDIGDTTPFKMVNLYGESLEHWNRHFVIQVASCPLNCWYCYVSNLKPNMNIDVVELVEEYKYARRQVPNLNVLHFMGGCPGRYSYLWLEIRQVMDAEGLADCLFLSDIILVENWIYGERPWDCIPDRSIISVCLKGSNFRNFERNTGRNLFAQALWELPNYYYKPQVHFSAIGFDLQDRKYLEQLLGNDTDWMTVKEYEVVKERLKNDSTEHFR